MKHLKSGYVMIRVGPDRYGQTKRRRGKQYEISEENHSSSYGTHNDSSSCRMRQQFRQYIYNSS